jgi:hypothetical protein
MTKMTKITASIDSKNNLFKFDSIDNLIPYKKIYIEVDGKKIDLGIIRYQEEMKTTGDDVDILEIMFYMEDRKIEDYGKKIVYDENDTCSLSQEKIPFN